MKTIARTLIAASAIVAGSTLTLAARADGFYLGGNVGSSHFRGDDVGGFATDRSDTGYKLYGGYSFNPYFGLEGGYADLGRFKSDGGSLRARGIFADAVGTLPLGHDFSLLGRVGLFTGRLSQDLNATDLAAASSERGTGTRYKLGAGVQYDLSKQIGLRAEWENYRFHAIDSSPNTNLYSIGVNYRF